jgi:hypothetical protein
MKRCSTAHRWPDAEQIDEPSASCEGLLKVAQAAQHAVLEHPVQHYGIVRRCGVNSEWRRGAGRPPSEPGEHFLCAVTKGLLSTRSLASVQRWFAARGESPGMLS